MAHGKRNWNHFTIAWSPLTCLHNRKCPFAYLGPTYFHPPDHSSHQTHWDIWRSSMMGMANVPRDAWEEYSVTIGSTQREKTFGRLLVNQDPSNSCYWHLQASSYDHTLCVYIYDVYIYIYMMCILYIYIYCSNLDALQSLKSSWLLGWMYLIWNQRYHSANAKIS